MARSAWQTLLNNICATMEHKSSILLVDNSNTRTKFSLREGRGHSAHAQACLPTNALSVESIRAMLEEKGWRYERTLICSVVPAAARVIAEAVGGDVQLLGADSPMNIALDYPAPHTLGADRIANAMGAASFAPMPCIVVDFGTAVTFDVLVAGEERPRFIGGVIAPGLGAMVQYLGRNTALLPALEPGKPERAIGLSTAEALHSGSYHGYCGLVRSILSALSAELDEKPCVIATGGDAALLADWLPEIDRVCPSLTFTGLELAAHMSSSC